MAVKKATPAKDAPASEAKEPATKLVSLTSPWGSTVTVDADTALVLKDQGFKPSK
jgi:DNA-binding MurR/RpiR family transcriptional regulator